MLAVGWTDASPGGSRCSFCLQLLSAPPSGHWQSWSARLWTSVMRYMGAGALCMVRGLSVRLGLLPSSTAVSLAIAAGAARTLAAALTGIAEAAACQHTTWPMQGKE